MKKTADFPVQKNINKKLGSYGRLGILLSLIGIILAIDTSFDLVYLYKFWPLLTTILGIGFIGIYNQRSRREASYIGIGTYLIMFSGLALYCSLTSWQNISKLWPLFITNMGIAFVMGYIFSINKPLLLLIGLLFLSVSLAFFFVFSLNNQLWWTILILTGMSFLVFDKLKN